MRHGFAGLGSRPRSSPAPVYSPQYRVLTLFLWLLWFTNAFGYYGMVLFTTTLVVDEGGGCDVYGLSPVPSEGFVDIFVSAAAEFPGLMLGFAIIDRIGRRRSQGLLFFLTGCFTLALLLRSVGASLGVLTIFLFGARATIEAAFAVSYVYTPEAYVLRAFGRWRGSLGALSPSVGIQR